MLADELVNCTLYDTLVPVPGVDVRPAPLLDESDIWIDRLESWAAEVFIMLAKGMVTASRNATSIAQNRRCNAFLLNLNSGYIIWFYFLCVLSLLLTLYL
ncbi:hypothetical protein EBZ57_01300 [bacterium]|nr:hypothetical protein [bacterium]